MPNSLLVRADRVIKSRASKRRWRATTCGWWCKRPRAAGRRRPLRSHATYLHLDHFAPLALKLGRTEDAARALGRSRAVIGASGDGREINEQRAHDDALAALQDAFAPAEPGHLFAEGAALSDDEAARLAIG